MDEWITQYIQVNILRIPKILDLIEYTDEHKFDVTYRSSTAV